MICPHVMGDTGAREAGIIADIHGNAVALRSVLKDAQRLEVDRWWALGDLVLFCPRPAEVLELLLGLPGIVMLRGNTDRYVLTGEQPAPHATAADAAKSVGLVGRYAAISVPYGVQAVVSDLHRRRHPNASFVSSILSRQPQM